jgi:DNA topoisomerase-1
MVKHLLIVESPAKARTIKKYLGPHFEVLASYGHVRDLRPKEGAVEPERGFAMHYEVLEKNAKHVSAIARGMQKADSLYLATDPDREGEAISWHLVEILKAQQALAEKPVHRVVFHEITRRAVDEAVRHPRTLSMALVNAQQARRALDYLVGFNLSPLLWRKIRRGLSAGRVQSPALRMIVERETEIESFVVREYWTIEADLAVREQPFTARLHQFAGQKLTQFSITSEAEARKLEQALLTLTQGQMEVSAIEKKQRRRNPAAPFTTSTLQQEAARKLGFTAQRTMRVAQQLYEGVETGSGLTGLITYMRTDSVTLAQEAVEELRTFIEKRYGKDCLPPQARAYKTKAKNAQEAHEAIRPTSVERLPEDLRQYLKEDQLALYQLIWKRTVACQMKHATINIVVVDLSCGKGCQFRATGSTVADPGFLIVYEEGVDDRQAEDQEEGRHLPPMAVGDLVDIVKLRPEQHFTEPPPRYTEATLVKSLEEYGIGRPSTYATIISTLQQRGYAVLEQKRFKPTDVGRIVNKFLTEHFAKYVDYEFTARLEDDLDAISRDEKEWIPLMQDFWEEFKQQLATKEQSVKRSDVTQETLEEKCPQCGRPLSIRLGRRGRFIGCTGYPECDYTRDLKPAADPVQAPKAEVIDHPCPQCQAPLVLKQGRYGRFIGCSNYPTCKHIEPLEKPVDTGIRCPQCHQGNLLRRKSRYGRIFYSCATYPACSYAVWNEPVAKPCPRCQWPLLTLKTTKRRGTEEVCPRKECGYTAPVETEEALSERVS